MRSRKRQAIGSKESRRTERRRRKARALNDSIEMGPECGEVERPGRKRALGTRMPGCSASHKWRFPSR